MAASRVTMANEVVFILGNRTELVDNAADWVRRAYQHLTQSNEVPEAAVTASIGAVVGTRTYAKPSDFYSMYSVRSDTTNTRLLQVSTSKYDGFNTTATGNIVYYAIDNANFLVHPTPATAETLQLRYRRLMPDLTTDSAVHLLPDIWDQIIITQAAIFGFDYLNDIERSRHYMGRVRDMVRTQNLRVAADLIDRQEAVEAIGMEIN